MTAPVPPIGTALAVYSEIGIIAQLTASLLERRLPRGMVAAQFAVLNHLSNRPAGCTPLHLARAFQVPKTSMTHSLSALRRAGFVETLPNPEDGRSKIVRITPAGAQFRTATLAAIAPEVAAHNAPLEPDTMDRLLPLLRHLRITLHRARDA